MRDGISIARLGIASVALITESFWPQGDFVARSLGMPDAPRVKLPHPVAGSGDENMNKIARDIVDDVLERLSA